MVLALLAVAIVTVVILMQQRPLLVDDFSGPNGLVTNEFAFFNQHNPATVRSPTWIVTSGSLFVHDQPLDGRVGPGTAWA